MATPVWCVRRKKNDPAGGGEKKGEIWCWRFATDPAILAAVAMGRLVPVSVLPTPSKPTSVAAAAAAAALGPLPLMVVGARGVSHTAQTGATVDSLKNVQARQLQPAPEPVD